jgi:beta-lactamase class A
VPIDPSRRGRLAAKLNIIEAASGGTLGVAFFNTATGAIMGHNLGARFGHCSSFKLALAALTLWRDEQGLVDADQRVTWSREELVSHSPYTAPLTDGGATLRELASATQRTSDNTAANILLRELGGPEALTDFWRMLGDTESRLDRTEPALNNVPASELRDTTTPAVMVRTVAKLCFGDVLNEPNRQTLLQWMVDTKTGARRVRAGLPAGWIAGDKAGTSFWPGIGSLYVDIGFVTPPARAPLTFATYYRAPKTHKRIDPSAEQTFANAGQVLAEFASF